jgi:uncharacterized damage-inducible protein DinB
MRYQFLIETYETERLKVLSVWSMFREEDLPIRPRADDVRGRSVLEHMLHQSTGEDGWFRTMLGIDVGEPPLPATEDRMSFIRRYAALSEKRLEALRTKADKWWEEHVKFFDVDRSRVWVMVRRIAHTSHHRGQQMAMLRMLGRDVHSNYGPTADTGGLPANGARVIYTHDGIKDLLGDGEKSKFPAKPDKPVTERPG